LVDWDGAHWSALLLERVSEFLSEPTCDESAVEVVRLLLTREHADLAAGQGAEEAAADGPCCRSGVGKEAELFAVHGKLGEGCCPDSSLSEGHLDGVLGVSMAEGRVQDGQGAAMGCWLRTGRGGGIFGLLLLAGLLANSVLWLSTGV
jgi:hypothetical protein